MVNTAANGVTSPEEETEPWQMKVTSLEDGIRHIYGNGAFYNVIFKVGGHQFKGHKIILGARSPKFAKMLLKPDSPCEIKDDSSKVGFEIMWRFIYTDELGTTDQNEILEAYRVAKKFEQNELINKCEDIIDNMDITDDNVITILNQVPDIDVLRNRCIQYFIINSIDVLQSTNFLKATPNTLQYIFKNCCLCNVPVFHLHHNIMKWGVNQFPEIDDYKLVRELLKDIHILGKLRIHKLPLKELADLIIKYPGLLTAEEYQQFNLHIFDTTYSLPEWCVLENLCGHKEEEK